MSADHRPARVLTEFEHEITEDAVRWMRLLRNELELLRHSRYNATLWNMLVDIKYHRPFIVMGVRYAGTVDDCTPIDTLRYRFTGGALDDVNSYATSEGDQVKLVVMNSSGDGARACSERMLTEPIDAEIMELHAEIARLRTILISVRSCAPPLGKEYQAAARRAVAHGFGTGRRLRARRSRSAPQTPTAF